MKSSTQVVQNLIKPYIDRNAANIAPVETSATAAAAHAAGTQIVYKGVLYDVTADIAQGDTITVGTNITAADPLSSEIQTLSNIRAELGAHNLLKLSLESMKELNLAGVWNNNSYTLKGVTFTINSDFTISVSGINDGTGEANFFLETYATASGVRADNSLFAGKLVIMSGCPSDGSSSTYFLHYLRYDGSNSITDKGNGTNAFTPVLNTQINNNSRINITIGNGYAITGTLLFKPMIRLADDTSTVYGDFSKPNTELTKDTKGLTDNEFANGCVNLLPCIPSSGVVDGVSWVVNSDGTVTATVAETLTLAVRLTYYNNNSLPLPVGRYKLIGPPNNSYASIQLKNVTQDDWPGYPVSPYEGYYFDYNGTDIFILRLALASGTPAGTYVFKPMITVADMPNSDYAHYVPYCKSNKELTEIKEVAITKYTGTKISTNDSRVYRCGNMVIADIYAIFNNAYSGASSILDIINERDRPLVDNGCSLGSKCSYLNIGNGTIKASDVSASGLVTGQLVWFAKV